MKRHEQLAEAPRAAGRWPSAAGIPAKSRFALLWLSAMVVLCARSPAAHAGRPGARPPEWFTTIDEGRQRASASGKDLLLVFTGRRWSHASGLLDREVLSQPEFAAATAEFVLVEIDCPREAVGPKESAESNSEPAEARDLSHFREWQQQYFIRGFPTIVVADRQGRPVGYLSYQKGTTPQEFLKSITRHRAARIARDEALQRAERRTGSDRARHLDSALERIALLLGTLDERNGDPLLAWYDDVIAQINRLDHDNGLGLRAKYERRRQAAQTHAQSERVFSRLRELQSEREILAYIDEVLPGVTDREMGWRLEYARQVHLEWDHQHAAAVENGRRLLDRSDLSRDQRESLRDRVARNLQELGRFREAVDEFDGLVTANKDRPARRFAYQSNRAWCLDAAASAGGPRDEAIVAFQQLRTCCQRGTDDWATATWGLSVQLQRSHRFREALALRKELVELDRSPEALLRLTETQISLGRTDDASRNLDEAERLISAETPRQRDDRAHADLLSQRVRELRRQLGQ